MKSGAAVVAVSAKVALGKHGAPPAVLADLILPPDTGTLTRVACVGAELLVHRRSHWNSMHRNSVHRNSVQRSSSMRMRVVRMGVVRMGLVRMGVVRVWAMKMRAVRVHGWRGGQRSQGCALRRGCRSNCGGWRE